MRMTVTFFVLVFGFNLDLQNMEDFIPCGNTYFSLLQKLTV